jgi:hypothetical protein
MSSQFRVLNPSSFPYLINHAHFVDLSLHARTFRAERAELPSKLPGQYSEVATSGETFSIGPKVSMQVGL